MKLWEFREGSSLWGEGLAAERITDFDCLAWSSDHLRLAAGTMNYCRATVWNLNDRYRPVDRWTIKLSDACRSLAFAPGMAYSRVGCRGWGVMLYDVARKAEKLATWHAHRWQEPQVVWEQPAVQRSSRPGRRQLWVSQVAFHPEGELLATGKATARCVLGDWDAAPACLL
jgi:WD40 repeat protein